MMKWMGAAVLVCQIGAPSGMSMQNIYTPFRGLIHQVGFVSAISLAHILVC